MENKILKVTNSSDEYGWVETTHFIFNGYVGTVEESNDDIDGYSTSISYRGMESFEHGYRSGCLKLENSSFKKSSENVELARFLKHILNIQLPIVR